MFHKIRDFLATINSEVEDGPVLRDVDLWDGKSELFVSWLPVPIQSTGPITLSPHTSLDYDRRFQRGQTRTGVFCVFYRGPGGFQHIVLEEKEKPSEPH